MTLCRQMVRASFAVIVDSHSHLYSQSYMELLRSRSEIPRIDVRDGASYFVIFPEEAYGGGRLMDATMWSIEEKLAAMDRGGFDRSVVSLGNPWLDPVRGLESIDWAAAADLVGPERILFGTDHPFFKEAPREIFETVAAAFGDRQTTIDAVAGANATAFFGLPPL